jgi:hypothetical protein
MHNKRIEAAHISSHHYKQLRVGEVRLMAQTYQQAIYAPLKSVIGPPIKDNRQIVPDFADRTTFAYVTGMSGNALAQYYGRLEGLYLFPFWDSSFM